MRVRLGINNCFALKRWPRPADWAAVVRDDLGLDLVELSLDLLEGFDVPGERRRIVEQTRAALADFGLKARGTFTGLSAYSLDLLMHPDPQRRAAARAWYREVVDLTAELGLRTTGGHVGAMSVPDWSVPQRRAERWAGLKDDLETIAAHARSTGLESLMLENLVAVREPSTMAQVEALLTDGDAAHVPWQLCLDVGHQCVPGTIGPERDPYAWLQHFGGRLVEVQLQQTDGQGDHHWAFTPARKRNGVIDAGRVLDTLAATGARDVFLMFEIIPGWEDPDGQVVRDLQASVGYWRSALDQRGLGK